MIAFKPHLYLICNSTLYKNTGFMPIQLNSSGPAIIFLSGIFGATGGNKVEAFKNNGFNVNSTSKDKHHWRHFIGIINLYRCSQKKQSHMLYLLIKLLVNNSLW